MIHWILFFKRLSWHLPAWKSADGCSHFGVYKHLRDQASASAKKLTVNCWFGWVGWLESWHTYLKYCLLYKRIHPIDFQSPRAAPQTTPTLKIPSQHQQICSPKSCLLFWSFSSKGGVVRLVFNIWPFFQVIFVGFLFELSYDVQHSLGNPNGWSESRFGSRRMGGHGYVSSMSRCDGATERDRLRPHEWVFEPPEKVSIFSFLGENQQIVWVKYRLRWFYKIRGHFYNLKLTPFSDVNICFLVILRRALDDTNNQIHKLPKKEVPKQQFSIGFMGLTVYLSAFLVDFLWVFM